MQIRDTRGINCACIIGNHITPPKSRPLQSMVRIYNLTSHALIASEFRSRRDTRAQFAPKATRMRAARAAISSEMITTVTITTISILGVRIPSVKRCPSRCRPSEISPELNRTCKPNQMYFRGDVNPASSISYYLFRRKWEQKSRISIERRVKPKYISTFSFRVSS